MQSSMGFGSKESTLSWDFRERSPAKRCVKHSLEGRVSRRVWGVGGFLGRALEKTVWNSKLIKRVMLQELKETLAAAERGRTRLDGRAVGPPEGCGIVLPYTCRAPGTVTVIFSHFHVSFLCIYLIDLNDVVF